MQTSQAFLTLTGAALMAWGGSSITVRLGLEGWHQGDVALFALGVVLLAQAPYLALLARIRRLEAEAKGPASQAAAPASETPAR